MVATAQRTFIDAAKEVIQNGRSLRTAASDFNINFIIV